MTVYNSNEKFLRDAINSVFNQTYKNFEFIIVNDGSNNGIMDFVLNEFKNSSLKIVNQKNSGLCNARNRGIKEAKGKYIAFIDDDDVWIDSKLQECLNYFLEVKKKDSNLGMIFSQSKIIDENDKEYGIFGYKVSGDIYEQILGKNIIGPPSSVFIEKYVFDKVGIFDNKYVYAEDIELWYRLTKEFHVYSIDKPLIKYRYRINSLSKNYRKMGLFTEMALIKALDNDLELENKNKILSKYYIDFAYLYFSNNDIGYFRKYYFNSIKFNFKLIFNIKLTIGIFLSLLGEKKLKKFNELRRSNDVIPPSYLKIYDYTGGGDDKLH
jgi:glycosyltransferase involved in cell wall biosynthesis